MAPTLPRLASGAAVSSSSSAATPNSKLDVIPVNVITLSSDDENVITLSSDDEQEASGSCDWSSPPPAAGSNPVVVITLSSSSDDEHESSGGSKAGPVVLISTDSDSDAELLAKCRKRRLPRNVAWVFHDEVNILKALADERLESGRLPGSPSALLDAIRRRVDLKRENPTAGDVAKKVRNLMDRFKKAIDSGGGPGVGVRDRELYDLSSKVWPELLLPIVHSSSSSSSPDGT